MLRQQLIARTVNGDNVIVAMAETVEEIAEIRKIMKQVGTEKKFSVTVSEESVECVYVELWQRDTGSAAILRCKTEAQQAAIKKNQKIVDLAAKAAEDTPAETEEKPKPKRKGRRSKKS